MTPTTSLPADDLAAEMRRFIIDQAEGRTRETVERYAQVTDDLMTFMDSVDVSPWLGPEVAVYIRLQRERLGPGAFLPSLGLVSLIRVLPAFVNDPWLPQPSPQRRTHRTAVRHLLTFLRRRAMQQGCFHREDLKSINKALGQAYASDYGHPPVWRSEKVTCTVTVELVARLVDALLEQVTRGEFETFDEAVAARLNPVKVTYWQEPDQELPYGW